ncbi:DUF6612 family protein [Sporosarcina beigongshangi]|uniref:DUF6612 family protein n=1 Tax=Sporosarcina beigongshangi TaxID=2782538 RepID=UPI00193A88BB|nr:DUF6612 family protein [Sporosarcina beigongshangi]
MKNWIKGMAVGVLALGLAACNTPAEPKTDAETGKKVELEEPSGLTAQEVFEKATEASAEQVSMHATMNINQLMEIPGQEGTMNSKIKMDMDMVVDPLAMYQKMDVDMGEQGVTEMEIYMTEEGFFMNDPMSGQWLKLPAEMYEDLLAQAGSADPTLDMNMFKEFVEDFKFEQTDDEYILKLSASGEKFSKLFKEIAMENLPADVDASAEAAELMENIEMKSLEYEIYIDKKTFYTNAFNMKMDMKMQVDGEEMRIDQKVNAKLSKINEIDKIEIPQEILDNALDINEAMGQ